MSDVLLLIDLAGLVHQQWHVSSKEPDPDYTSQQAIARVHALASAHPHAAICIDRPPYLRKLTDPAYKANRPEQDAALRHQMAETIHALRRDGFPVWGVNGYEADDVIASAVKQATAMDGDVLIVSSDKDLLCLASERMQVKSLTNGAILGPADVLTTFGVRPDQMLDYLCLVGDSSDNVKGADGIGPKKAATLLAEYGTLTAVYAALDTNAGAFTPGLASSLAEFRPRWPTVRQLIALASDLTLPFHEIATERQGKAMSDEQPTTSDDFNAAVAGTLAAIDPSTALGDTRPPRAAIPPTAEPSERVVPSVGNSGHLTVLPPVEWDRELEPRNMDDAVKLAARMFDARMFNGYGTPQAVLATIIAGRELGMPAMVSLRAFHIIEGKSTLSAQAIVARVLASGKARYFRCAERTPTQATYETCREGDTPMSITYSIAEGRTAFGFHSGLTGKALESREEKWLLSGWGRNPADMCVARASSKLARLVYPDVTLGLYAPEEME